ncbi:hypothetical protein FYL21_10235, partial [Lactobacillus salivarius]|nr:hypothetical protein [Ligilactobacillus salivarius]
MAGKQVSSLLLAIVVIAGISGFCSAATHVVGDRTGWTIPSSPSFYSDWASRQTFAVGDVLVFNFPANQHTVAAVTKANYDSCGTTNTIGAVMSNPPANVTLTAGTHYYVCTIGTHCAGGQKLAVTVGGPSGHYYVCTIGTHCAGGQKLAVTVGGPSGSPASAPTPTGGANTPTGSTTPAGEPTAAGGGAADSPGAAGTTDGPSGSTPPGNFATSTSVGLLSLVS